MNMAAMNKGEFCGACHNGKTAFGTEDKSKCHECHGKQHRHHGGMMIIRTIKSTENIMMTKAGMKKPACPLFNTFS